MDRRRRHADPNSYPDAAASFSLEAALLLEPKLEDDDDGAPLQLASPIPYVPLDQLMPAAAVHELHQPRPLEALLQGPQLPPFLSKTYDLVTEPALDGVISWGASGNSFVVWEPSTFARDVLPQHFKHNNFSSFVRQLNTYGFRKVHADRWEFAHEDFLRNSKHLLKRIVRRRSSPTQQSSILADSSSGDSSVDPEVHTLRREKNALLEEVARLKQEHRQTIEQMSTLNQRLESADDRQKQMVSFLAKLLQNPTFVEKLKLHWEQKDIDSTRIKRKFLMHVPHDSTESGESISQHTGESGSHFPVSSPLATNVQDDIAELQNFLLEDDGLNFCMDPDSIGINGVEAPDDISALVHGFDTQEELELGSGTELLEMPPASGPLGQDPIIGTMLETAEKMMDADDELMWGVDASGALQSSCSGTSQQAFGSLDNDPYLMDITTKPERLWDLDFQDPDQGVLQLDKCAIDDPALQYQQQRNMKP